MKRFILILMILPTALMARQSDPNLPMAQLGAAISERAIAAAAGVQQSAALETGEDSVIPPTFAPTTEGTPQQPSGQGSPPSSSPSTDRPKTNGSMVGYIDNAIVGSQVIVRSEADIDDETPDLAEYLFAACRCAYIPNAPGPTGLASTLNFEELRLYGEYAFNNRFSLFTEVPFRWVQPQSFVPGLGSFMNQGGLSDINAGFKFAILASGRHYVSIKFLASFPTGNASRGLGTNHYSVEPSVLYYQPLSRRLTLESEVGDWHPIGGSTGFSASGSGGFAGDVFFYGVGPSYEVYSGERVQVAPVIELVGWQVLGGFQTVGPFLPGNPCAESVCSAAGTSMLNLKAGARITFGAHSSLYAGYGRALTDAYWYKRIFRLEYRYSF